MTDEPRCKNCARFTAWPVSRGMYYDHEPNGVCTAPRPLLGPQPNREVQRNNGKNCPMWEEALQ